MPHASLPANPSPEFERAPDGLGRTAGAAAPDRGRQASPAQDRMVQRALGTAAEQLGDGRFDEATRVLAQVLRQWPDCADALNLLGVAAYGRGDEKAAIGHFERALALDERLAGAHANVGLAHLNQGRMREGTAALARALALDPAHGAALCGMAAVLLRGGALRQAEALYRRAASIAPLLFEPESRDDEAAAEGSWPDRLIEAVSRLPAPARAERGGHAP